MWPTNCSSNRAEHYNDYKIITSCCWTLVSSTEAFSARAMSICGYLTPITLWLLFIWALTTRSEHSALLSITPHTHICSVPPSELSGQQLKKVVLHSGAMPLCISAITVLLTNIMTYCDSHNKSETKAWSRRRDKTDCVRTWDGAEWHICWQSSPADSSVAWFHRTKDELCSSVRPLHTQRQSQSQDVCLKTKGGFHRHQSNCRFTELQLFLTAS